jgi:RNA polymerase sigma-70 factor (ECF subfamily)
MIRRHATDDAALITRVLRGDPAAYAPLVERHQGLLYRYARGMGLDADTAQDMAQDCFIKAYSALAECREPHRFEAWLLRILRNRCLDHLKNVRQRVLRLDEAPADHAAAQSTSGTELRHEIDSALAALSPLLREAFLLKHEAGYTYDEIASITHSTPSAVKMRVQRAREELRAIFRDERAEAV